MVRGGIGFYIEGHQNPKSFFGAYGQAILEEIAVEILMRSAFGTNILKYFGGDGHKMRFLYAHRTKYPVLESFGSRVSIVWYKITNNWNTIQNV